MTYDNYDDDDDNLRWLKMIQDDQRWLRKVTNLQNHDDDDDLDDDDDDGDNDHYNDEPLSMLGRHQWCK